MIAYPRGADPLVSNVLSLTFNRPYRSGGARCHHADPWWMRDNHRLDKNETLSSMNLTRDGWGAARCISLIEPLHPAGCEMPGSPVTTTCFWQPALAHPDLLVGRRIPDRRGGSVLAAVLWVKKNDYYNFCACGSCCSLRWPSGAGGYNVTRITDKELSALRAR